MPKQLLKSPPKSLSSTLSLQTAWTGFNPYLYSSRSSSACRLCSGGSSNYKVFYTRQGHCDRHNVCHTPGARMHGVQLMEWNACILAPVGVCQALAVSVTMPCRVQKTLQLLIQVQYWQLHAIGQGIGQGRGRCPYRINSYLWVQECQLTANTAPYYFPPEQSLHVDRA